MLNVRYNIVQRGGQWWAVFGRDQLGPFGINRAAVDAAEVEVSVRRKSRHQDALGGPGAKRITINSDGRFVPQKLGGHGAW